MTDGTRELFSLLDNDRVILRITDKGLEIAEPYYADEAAQLFWNWLKPKIEEAVRRSPSVRELRKKPEYECIIYDEAATIPPTRDLTMDWPRGGDTVVTAGGTLGRDAFVARQTNAARDAFIRDDTYFQQYSITNATLTGR